MSVRQVLLETVVPAFGALISTIMYASPMKAVLKASKERSIGDLNPIPFAVTIANTIIWLAYGLLKKDPFVTTPNTPGVLIACFMTLTAYGLSDEKVRSQLRLVVCITAAILPVLGVLTAFAAKSATEQLAIWGLAGNLISLVYYGAPLSSMFEVIKSRNSASILLPLTITNTANAALWTTYGLAVTDPYIWLPNGLGLILSCAQVVLRMTFPSKPGAAVPNHTHHAGTYARLDPEQPDS